MIDVALGRHRADEVTDVLVDANLLQLVETDMIGQPRYRLHDLVRCNAREKATGASDRHALLRVLGAWTAGTESAAARLPTTIFSLTSASATRWNLAEDTLGRLTADPLSWFDAEHDALVGAVGIAAAAGLAGSAWGLATALVPYFDLRCHFDEWCSTHRIALEAARLAGDRHGEAAMLRGLAQVSLYRDRYAEATEMFRRSLAIFHELGDPRGEAASICGLGAVSQFCGRTSGRSPTSGGLWPCSSPWGTGAARPTRGRPSGGPAWPRATCGRLRAGWTRRCGWPGSSVTPIARAACPCSSGGCTT